MLSVKIVTPLKVLLDGQAVKSMQIPAHLGELGLYPGHADLVTLLSGGVITYILANSSVSKKLAVGWGYLQVYQGEVSLLVDRAVEASEVSKDICEQKLKNLEERCEVETLNFKQKQDIDKEIAWQKNQLSLLN